MNRRYLVSPVCIAAVAIAAASLTGCSSSDPAASLADVNESNVQRLANLYFTYQKKHDFRGPKDEQDFRQFIQSFDPNKLQRIGVDPGATDSLFVSERDGQPFKIRYGVRGSMMGSREPVIFEAEGEGGTRVVGFLDMSQREVDAAEYEQLLKGQAPNEPVRVGKKI